MLEYEKRADTDMEVIMCGQDGQVYQVGSAKDLLPLYFSGSDL
jgi:hypothetical protein